MTLVLYQYISDRVQLHAKENQKTYRDMADALNVSESFIQKVHIHQKHYNTSHLYILSRLFNCSVAEFFPTDFNTFKRVYPFSTLKESDFENFLTKLEDEIKYKREEL